MGALTNTDPHEVLSKLESSLLCKTVTEVRYMEKEEVTHLEKEYGYRFCGRPLVIVFGEHTHYIFPGINGSLMLGNSKVVPCMFQPGALRLVKSITKLPPRADTDFVLSQSVDILELSTRPSKCLENARIHTIEQLCSTGEGDLLRIKLFGRGSLNEVKAALAEYGLTLKGYRT